MFFRMISKESVRFYVVTSQGQMITSTHSCRYNPLKLVSVFSDALPPLSPAIYGTDLCRLARKVLVKTECHLHPNPWPVLEQNWLLRAFYLQPVHS